MKLIKARNDDPLAQAVSKSQNIDIPFISDEMENPSECVYEVKGYTYKVLSEETAIEKCLNLFRNYSNPKSVKAIPSIFKNFVSITDKYLAELASHFTEKELGMVTDETIKTIYFTKCQMIDISKQPSEELKQTLTAHYINFQRQCLRDDIMTEYLNKISDNPYNFLEENYLFTPTQLREGECREIFLDEDKFIKDIKIYPIKYQFLNFWTAEEIQIINGQKYNVFLLGRDELYEEKKKHKKIVKYLENIESI